MNTFRTRAMMRSAAAVILLCLSACSGGGGGGGRATFSLFSVEPAESLDLNGGDQVIIHGDNFLAARVARVTFGDGNPGFNMQVLDDERIQVTTPPSPTGQPAIVTVEVETLELGTKGIFGGYRYVGSGGPIGPPQPQSIFPTTFTATGAQLFTIQGTDLGPNGGTVTVDFGAAGSVIADITGNGTIATGRAPVTTGVPPTGPLTVTVDNNGDQGVVPTQVSYVYTAPTKFAIARQEGNDNASRPVRISDTLAVMATPGIDVTWGNGNDDLILISGPPGTIQTRSLLGTQAAALRNLDRNNSIPVALDEDTICVYSPGVSAALGNELILVISNLGAATPTVTSFQPTGNMAPIPLGRVSSNRVGFIQRGTGTTGQDQLQVATVFGGAVTGLLPNAIDIQVADANGIAGRRNLSIPFSPDGDAVFVYSFGFNGLAGDSDDVLVRRVISTAQTTLAQIPFVLTKPMALSSTRLVAISGGTAATPADVDDQLTVIDLSAGTSVAYVDLNATADVGAPRAMVRMGTDGLILIAGGPDMRAFTADDVLAVFTDDGAGSYNRADTSLAQRPSLVTLGNGEVLAFGRGNDNIANTGDDRAIRILADGSGLADFTGPPNWSLATGVLSDDSRAFANGDGFDVIPTSGDEELLVFQAASLGRGNATCVLPISLDLNTPIRSTVTNPIVFVPVGPGWGVIQSPGRDGLWLSADDQILVVQY